jgi:hypothetical protein
MSVEVALKFFNALFGEEDELEQGLILITNLNEFKFFKSQTEAAKFAISLSNKKTDTYFGTGLYNGIPKSTSGLETDIGGRPAFCIDIDVKGQNHKKDALVESLEEGFELLKTAFPIFEPTIINLTGGGAHVYYKFKELEWFDNDEQRKKHKELAVKVHKTVEAVFNARGYKLDNVSNLNRILRVPGTYNFKHGAIPVYTKVIDQQRELLPEDFEPFLCEVDVQERIKATPKRISEGKNPLNIKAEPDASPPFEKLTNLLELNPRFKAIWVCGKGIRREYKDDMSSMDMALANIAMNMEWSDQEIANLIINFRRINGDEKDRQKSMRTDYLCFTINKSRDKLKRTNSIEELAQKSQDVVCEEVEEKKQELREDIFSSLKEILGVTINEVRMFVGDETTFEIDVNGVTCPIGPINKLFSQTHVMQQVSIVARQYIYGVDKKDWPNIVTILLKNAVEIKIDFCMTEVGILKERIRNYVEDVTILDDRDEAFQSGGPFNWKDELYIFIGSFRTWLAGKGDKTDSKTLGQNLKKLGLESKVMKFRKRDGKETTRWVYKVDKDEDVQKGNAG